LQGKDALMNTSMISTDLWLAGGHSIAKILRRDVDARRKPGGPR
jgi:hypothetical protein